MAKVNRRPLYQIINGIRIPVMFSPEHFQEALDYKPKPEDVFIVTYPKCGTTWMQHIVMYIFRKGQELENPQDFKKLCPFIDPTGTMGIEAMPRPGAFKTHLPYTHMPYSPEAKYIIVLRNPKDCCVSMFYHTKNNPFFMDADFDEFFELFMSGEVEYNNYFDHLMSWYPHRNDNQIFFTTYEEMKKDTKNVVLSVAGFLGKEYLEAIQNDNAVLNNILHFSGFEYMRENFSVVFDHKPDKILKNPEFLNRLKSVHGDQDFLSLVNEKPRTKFIRKGVIGDWRSHFSAEQSKILSKTFLERTTGTEIQEFYLPFM